ncbi:hypothetical protein ACTHPF_11790 [Paenibacillus sp. SAF-054]|uniref:hypothetical protein n=1 Tax=unclassified Paenibacillus TaxID=185978 RepID=UPI003F80A7D9
MIPFANTWPYDKQMGDIYVHECPFCGAGNVRLNLKPSELKTINEGRKKLVVFPCCSSRLNVLETDNDYLRFDQPVR